MHYKAPILMLTLIPLVSYGADKQADDQETFCNDPAVIANWDKQAREFPYDNAVQTLHALWLGLCEKIHEGTIEAPAAITLFELERARQTLERAREEQDRSRKSRT
jgi:hypothetical protein